MEKCFIVSPIGGNGTATREHADTVQDYLIKPVCDELGLDAIRADQIPGSSKIDDEIFEHLSNDYLVIADLTDLNPNVLIEVGYRLRDGKPMVFICDEDRNSRLPFDVQGIRTCFYLLDLRNVGPSKEKLRNFILAALEKSENYYLDLKATVSNCRIKTFTDKDGMTVRKSSIPEKYRTLLLDGVRNDFRNPKISWD